MPELHLRGGRFRPLAYADLNPAQKAVADAALAAGRKSFDGPFNITLRSPEMTELSGPLDAYLRTKSTAIPAKLKEIAIMLTARFWGCLLYTSPSPRDRTRSRMPSSA